MDAVLGCHFDNFMQQIYIMPCTYNKLRTPKTHIDTEINFKDLDLVSHDAHTQTHDGDLNPCPLQNK